MKYFRVRKINAVRKTTIDTRSKFKTYKALSAKTRKIEIKIDKYLDI